MNLFERYLSIWVLLCIVAGIALGHWFPDAFQLLGKLEIASVNLPVAVLVWLMILPMLLKIDFRALQEVRQHARGIGITPDLVPKDKRAKRFAPSCLDPGRAF